MAEEYQDVTDSTDEATTPVPDPSTIPPDQDLTEKLTRIGYPDFEQVDEDTYPDFEQVDGDTYIMLHVDGHFICGVKHALTLDDDELKSLIDETIGYVEPS